MPRPTHFEIQADDPERARAFYAHVFGWAFEKIADEPMAYWYIVTGDEDRGINGGMHVRSGPKPVEGQAVIGFVCTMDVDDLDATLDRALSAGASLAVAKMPIPGVGWQAYVKDTEGNIIGLHQSDASAGR
ncbi:MAG: VOC family protein [Pseudomonadota bacterium]